MHRRLVERIRLEQPGREGDAAAGIEVAARCAPAPRCARRRAGGRARIRASSSRPRWRRRRSRRAARRGAARARRRARPSRQRRRRTRRRRCRRSRAARRPAARSGGQRGRLQAEQRLAQVGRRRACRLLGPEHRRELGAARPSRASAPGRRAAGASLDRQHERRGARFERRRAEQPQRRRHGRAFRAGGTQNAHATHDRRSFARPLALAAPAFLRRTL